MIKAEALRYGIAIASLTGAVALGESSLHYDKEVQKLSNQVNNGHLGHERIAVVDNDQGMLDSEIAFGGILLFVSGLSGSETTSRYIVKAFKAANEPDVRREEI